MTNWAHRGATGAAVLDARDRRRRRYAEDDPFKAQDAINDNNTNKGARMLVTNQMASAFRRYVVGCRAYYTRAYTSLEKDSVENCNRFVRRWYPKGTDFGRCTRAEMHRLERVINSIHHKLLNGKTAYEYDTAYSRAA